MAIKSGKLDGGESSRKPLARMNDNEVSNVKKYNSNNITVSRPQATTSSALNPVKQGVKEPRQEREMVQFDPIPMTYKELFQILLRQRNVINFGDSEQPNVAQNPLPNHVGVGVNAVIEERGNEVIIRVNEVKSPMHWLWGQMVKLGWLTFNDEGNKHACPYHRCEDHVIQYCDEFKALVQRLMDSKDMEFYNEAKKEKDVEIFTSEGTSNGLYNTNCPLVITSKAWTIEKTTSSDLEKRAAVDKGERVEILLKDDEPTIKEPVTENEAVEFLNFLKHSEYIIVEQLHKLPARISILALLLSSKAHRNALLKVLNQNFVPKDVLVEKIDRLVANIQADNFISFSDDEIPSGMMGNPKAMHITIRCKGHVLSRVLIDNGSALNMMPLITLKKLPVDSTQMRNCQSIVRAFDRTKKEVLGKIDIPLTIGPSTYEVEFLVMDIMPSYNCLLGRHWIHQTGAVPSTLHQKLKFVIEGRLVCLNAEEDIIASISTTAPKKIPKPRLSNCTKMELKMTLGRGAKVGRGLGSRLQGNISPVFPNIKRDHFGLGYRPTLKEKLKNGARSSKEPVIENALRDLGINVISEEGIEDGMAMGIYPAPPGFVLNNWTAEELHVVYKIVSETSGINSMNVDDSDLKINIELPICQGEIGGYDSDEVSDLPSELLKMVEKEDKQILLHEEPIDILNLGSEEDKKEIKIGTIISAEG
ncbi:uncharacterized protein LOC120117212 [Hibiscus syriacus]|uniref:uncharacterized protein LOC120117212 n=1 Tax=Hibiscus syriacus TaxID=106335 RepID=UPI0019227817|nr:uncharacterized protein LOC120117212 [Hibiscus syriacus]